MIHSGLPKIGMSRHLQLHHWSLFLVLVVALLLPPAPAYADSWALPVTRDYFSENRDFRFTVIPRELRSQLGYFSDKVTGRDPAGQLPGGALAATGILSRRRADGSYNPVWQKTLSNDVAPVSAIVSPSGEYVVTFDNWHSMGYGRNVVVIYGPDGMVIREFGLNDLLSTDETERLPRTVSSIWWGRGHHFDESGKFLVLRIAANRKMPSDRDAQFRLLHIELATGRVLTTG
ncbi:MAG: hypothetical protein HYT78_08325 [Deltaproteobacteria bacterium]|nr:hypothetical protein [Deltaproteobacteria bacterium]